MITFSKNDYLSLAVFIVIHLVGVLTLLYGESPFLFYYWSSYLACNFVASVLLYGYVFADLTSFAKEFSECNNLVVGSKDSEGNDVDGEARKLIGDHAVLVANKHIIKTNRHAALKWAVLGGLGAYFGMVISQWKKENKSNGMLYRTPPMMDIKIK